MRKFLITDAIHCDGNESFTSLDAALKRLRRLARTPWNERPNRAPCSGWWGCGRDWEIEELEVTDGSWELRAIIPGVAISHVGVTWHSPFRASRPFARRNRSRRRRAVSPSTAIRER
jgi:hypothetical protein